MVEVGSVRIDHLASREVNGAMLRGGVDGLSGYTEPGAKRVRMRTGLVMPMVDLVGNDMRKRKPNRGEEHPCQHDDQMQPEVSAHRRKNTLS